MAFLEHDCNNFCFLFWVHASYLTCIGRAKNAGMNSNKLTNETNQPQHLPQLCLESKLYKHSINPENT